MLALALSLVLSAPVNPRLAYEQKCLYCHSEEVTEARKYTEPQWRRLIEQMRKRAPLLIARSDVELLTRYVTRTLKLVAPSPTTKAGTPGPLAPAPSDLPPEPPPSPPPLTTSPAPEPVAAPARAPTPEPAAEPADPELEQRATSLIGRRCSKCHQLGRVYLRLDSYERSRTTLERMRLKTGSGITDADFALLDRYLRAQFD